MKTPSQSPDRHTFQEKGYVKRMEEKGETPSKHYLDYFQQILENHKHKFDDPQSHVNNLEYDLLTTDWILEKVRSEHSYAQNLYAAMCNNGFIKMEVIPILKNQEWSCSWRYAGGIVADMCQEGDYIDWYCSGIRGGDEPDVYEQPFTNKFVGEGCITDEIRQDLQRLGWAVVPGGDWENF
jgi:hypothetical protein